MKLPIVVVTWVDAHTSHGWEGVDEADAEGSTCYTVGFLIRSSRDAITVASSSDRNGNYNSRITIPRGMVRTIKRMRIDPEVENASKKTDRPATA
jgi:hypothetical protein